ncbi:MAG: type II toxin-antitoxin system prevent-host-death family antitoxin [Trueperaceae bacterium]|nr:type II toxin-antitoxin system prevent-host-death family antitoxin [Trueperaceae bacterium]MCC6309893.1 type II toxin-antitoxin system prevent-host-death family antitoxin [Trueperaceae bacterium]MCW5818793.1 type II toxin-antitoxin system prevent-host-death family antitoxin [Trueperaceae bacterium]
MTRITAHELRTETRRILQRVEAGEEVVIVENGREVAVIKPLPRPRMWQSGPALFNELSTVQADAGLTTELEAIVPGWADEVPLPRVPGRLKGKIVIPDDFDDPLTEDFFG